MEWNFAILNKDTMTLKRNMKHPNFILGLISYLSLLVGIILLASNLALGRQLIILSFFIGGIHWIASIIDVCTDPNLNDQHSRYFWLAIVIMIPPMAGMIYYMIDGRRFSY